MGQRDVKRILNRGAMTAVRWASLCGAPTGSWIARRLVRKPKMLVAVALVNRMARIACALITNKEVCRERAPCAG